MQPEHRIKFQNESYVPGFSYTAEDIVWAASMLLSRKYGEVNVNQSCLIPIGDLINHHHDVSQVPRYSVKEHTVEWIAVGNIAEGEEILTNYAESCREEMQAGYGFYTGEELPWYGSSPHNLWSLCDNSMHPACTLHAPIRSGSQSLHVSSDW